MHPAAEVISPARRLAAPSRPLCCRARRLTAPHWSFGSASVYAGANYALINRIFAIAALASACRPALAGGVGNTANSEPPRTPAGASTTTRWSYPGARRTARRPMATAMTMQCARDDGAALRIRLARAVAAIRARLSQAAAVRAGNPSYPSRSSPACRRHAEPWARHPRVSAHGTCSGLRRRLLRARTAAVRGIHIPERYRNPFELQLMSRARRSEVIFCAPIRGSDPR